MRYERFSFLVTSGFLLVVTVFCIAAFPKATTTGQLPAPAKLSHARVVRLSFVEGAVTVRTAGSTDWTKAMMNSPIEEGFSLATAQKSFAEVEFENGSTVRLGELSQVDFTQLALTPEGGHINHVTLDQGYATFHVIPEHHDEYLVNASGVSLTPHGKAEFRADTSQDHLRVEVFEGHVLASASNQSETLSKNHTLVRDTSSNASNSSSGSFQVTDKIQKDEWDKWSDARQEQANLAFNDSAVGPASAMYGWNDLDVYGDWSYFPGYGVGWAPYEPMGWSPYSSGMWGSYPSMGYTWISGEPWGWLPFHYGYWNFNQGMGWFWMPGSSAVWSPALVNWYSGPGWIGWTPVGAAGVGGRAPCTLATSGCLTAVPPNVLANRDPIAPGNSHVLHPTSIQGVTAIERPNVVPNRLVSSGRAFEMPARRTDSSASPFMRGSAAAPSSIIMGRQISADSFMGHRSALGSIFRGREPARVQLGSTMGGRVPIRNGVGVAPGLMSARGPRAASTGRSGFVRPQILSRGSAGGVSPAQAGLASRGGMGSLGVIRGGGANPGMSRGGEMSHASAGRGVAAGHSGGGGGRR